MTRDEALAMYNAGSAVVVKALCYLCDTVNAQQQQIKDLQIKIAKLSKNSSNSSKRPSSDDITKPKKTIKRTPKMQRVKSEASRAMRDMFAIPLPRMKSKLPIRIS